MEKGKRVKVISGRKGRGVTGTVFWVGENKYGSGERIGLEGDDGETYWLSTDNVEETTAPPPAPEGPPPEKGSRVRWKQGDLEGEGTVFWVGQSKNGRGLRVGLNDLDGETRWLDARMVKVIEGEPEPPVHAPVSFDEPAYDAPVYDDDEPPPFDGRMAPTGPDDMPPEPPAPEPPADWDDEDPPF